MRYLIIVLPMLIYSCTIQGQEPKSEVQSQKENTNISNIEGTADEDTLLMFLRFMSTDPRLKNDGFVFLNNNWSESYRAPLVDILRLSKDRWQVESVDRLFKRHAPDLNLDFYNDKETLWKDPPSYGNYYLDLKSQLYKYLDPKFSKYFYGRNGMSTIRVDEIMWGGVVQDGIPPLRNPEMLKASEADYLGDSDVVFGLVVDGDARAYPKRILAWHEFFTDEIGGKSLAGVYCTLCGTVIIYDAEVNGVRHELGTSGFLYRSNKLMYDKATQSLWNTILGKPVLGPLINQGIEMNTLPVVTTTWGEWKAKHPKTQVLSLETGHRRNYDEGVAYKEYFATDELMFPVPQIDKRLDNKARVFIPRIAGYKDDPIAISVDYLKKKKFHQNKIGDQNFLVITSYRGASSLYGINNQKFKSYKKGVLKDDQGNIWEVNDDKIIGPNGEQLLRLPAHESFWFAWYNTYPKTRLVK
ncbi:DUF3179 domain-containing protein [Saprospiraceae bacterium]|nr:DUF3179 domain-containing protein [Saprospiraceae bacterium]